MRAFTMPAVALAIAGCAPDVGADAVPEAMEFDPAATPARVPEPTLLVIDRSTRRIDLGLAGIEVPADCNDAGAMAMAQCEFYQYLESLDGFPTVTPARAPATAALDLATVAAPGNLFVHDAAHGAPVPRAAIGFDEADRRLTVDPRPSWPVGSTIWVGVRGYARGVRARSGREVVGSVVSHLLKQEQSLSCGATRAADVDPKCPYRELMAQRMTPAAAAEAVIELEDARQRYREAGAWDIAAGPGGVPGAELAVLWGFPVHTASVVELDPARGLVPRVVGPAEVRLAVNGTINPATVTPFAVGRAGTVYLLDLSAVAGGNLLAGFPPFDATAEGDSLILRARAALDPAHTYGILLTRGITNASGAPFVSGPASFLLRACGRLTDGAGGSVVDGVTDADARELESGRAELQPLLDNPTFAGLTGLRRADLVYVYAFRPSP